MKKEVKYMKGWITRIFSLLLITVAAISLAACVSILQVTFDADNGTEAVVVEVNRGETVDEPIDPIKSGYTFGGWYLGNVEFDFSTPVEESITLVAHWIVAETFTVTFDTVGATAIPDQVVESGQVATEPSAPVKEYFSFDGWLLNDEVFVFTTPITGDITLKANFSFIGIPDTPAYEGRAYNEDFDQMINDFTSSSLNTTLAFHNAGIDSDQPYIFVGYSGEIGNNPNGALWKQAGPDNESAAAFQYLVLRLRGFAGASIEDLSIGFRLDDNHEVLVIPLTETYDPDLEPISRELDSEWYNYVISITDTLDGKTFTAKPTYSDAAGSGLMVGFHLMNTSETGSGIIEIKDAYYAKVPNPIYPYEGSDYSQNASYWSGTVGKVVSTYVTIESDGSYAEYLETASGENTHLVLRLRQEEVGTFNPSMVAIAPVYNDGSIGDPITFDDIEGIPILGSDWINVTIPFSEIDESENQIAGYQLVNDGEVAIAISQSFLSYLGDYEAVSYPVLDLENALIYDNFDRTTIGTTSVWTSDNQTALDNGFTYLISYGGLQASSIADGAITFDSTGGTYVDYVVHSSTKANMNEYRYLVFKYKLENDGTLNDLRIQQKDYNDANVGGVIYAADWVAGLGLPSIPEDELTYPYSDGIWSYLIVDLTLTAGYSPDFAGFTLYYTGSALTIDTIMFANALDTVDYTTPIIFATFEGLTVDESAQSQISTNQWWANVYGTPATIVIDGEGQALQIDGTAYAQYHTASKGTGHYLAFDLKVTTPGVIESFRLGPDGNIKWVKDGEVILANGVPMVVNADGQWHHYIIDWLVSGFSITDTIGFHASDGEIYLLDNLTWLEPKPYFDDELLWGDFEWATIGDANGQLGPDQWWANNYGTLSSIVDDGFGNLVLQLDASSSYAQYHTAVKVVPQYIAFDLTVNAAGSLGINVGGTHVWNEAIIGLDGNPITMPDVGETKHIVVDVAQSGLTPSDTFGIEADGGAILLIDNISFQRDDMFVSLHNVLSNDFETEIVDDGVSYWWHSGIPADGVLNMVSLEYLSFRFGSPKITNTTIITLDAKLLDASANANTFRLELGDGNVVNWSTLVADGVVSDLTVDMQTFVIDVTPYLVGHPSGLQVFGFHINGGSVIVDNLNFYQNEYAWQIASFSDDVA